MEINIIYKFNNITEEELGVVFENEDDGCVISSFNNSDFSGTCCTGYAYSIYLMMPERTKIYGFHIKENPTAEYFVNEAVCDGHDFAVVDNRYIIDPWLKYLPAVTSQVVFDLNNPKDFDNIKKYYGNPKCWSDNTKYITQ